MNVISWENGDTTITDLPDCSDKLLAKIVQRVNDHICTHRDGDLLCADCSVKVLALGHRTVGTGSLPLTDLERRRVHVRLAAFLAREVLHLAREKDHAVCIAAIEAAEAWADQPSAAAAAAAYAAEVAAADAAYAYAADAAYAYAADAAHAVNAAANAAAAAAYADAAYAYAAAAHAAAAYAHAHAADAATEAAARLRLAHRAIDKFEELTGHVAKPVPADVVESAYLQMIGA
jgi:hypothetical protein